LPSCACHRRWASAQAALAQVSGVRATRQETEAQQMRRRARARAVGAAGQPHLIERTCCEYCVTKGVGGRPFGSRLIRRLVRFCSSSRCRSVQLRGSICMRVADKQVSGWHGIRGQALCIDSGRLCALSGLSRAINLSQLFDLSLKFCELIINVTHGSGRCQMLAHGWPPLLCGACRRSVRRAAGAVH
jgi:hypothetical protein